MARSAAHSSKGGRPVRAAYSLGFDMKWEIKIGLDGKRYMVFRDSYERERFVKRNDLDADYLTYKVASFGQFENAICLEQ